MSNTVLIPLVEDFRFVHEPCDFQDQTRTGLNARTHVVDQLTSRILMSQGGAFLLAGYRGVGKTTLVNTLVGLARTRFHASQVGDVEARLVHIPLTLARPVPADKLMYRLIVSLHEELARQGLLNLLPARLRAEIDLAVRRTSMSIAIRDLSSSQTTLSADLPLAIPGNLSATSGTQRAVTNDTTYLTYDDVTAEQDLIRIARALTRPSGVPLRVQKSWFSWSKPRRLRLKLLFVFDEMDKLEGGDEGVDGILQTLKTLLTTSGMSFLFVTGRALYDRYRDDVSRGDSVYESVFSYVQYIPALWDGVDSICDPLVEPAALERKNTLAHSAFSAFRDYLTYRGRGIPRRILRGLHDFVSVEESGRAYLKFDTDDVRRFRLYAEVEKAISDAERKLIEPSYLEQEAHRVDQDRLLLRYLTDWILDQRSTNFTIEDVISAARTMSHLTERTDRVAASMVRGLIAALIEHDLLERVENTDATMTVVVADAQVITETYRIPWPRLIELGQKRPGEPLQSTPGAPEEALDLPDRYSITEFLGQGSFASAYEARDAVLGRNVAIKVFPQNITREARESLKAEVDVISALKHPNIVEYVDADVDAARPYIVISVIDGLNLRDFLRSEKTLSLQSALTITRAILTALDYLHGNGFLWGDAKLANVMISEMGRVVLIDFGSAHSLAHVKVSATAVGTPRYMAPERFLGQPIDTRSDLFSVGAILYELLTGAPAFPGRTQNETVKNVLSGHVPAMPSKGVPLTIKKTLRRALAYNPEERFATAAEMLADLPEGGALIQLGEEVARAREFDQAIAARESEQTIPWPIQLERTVAASGSAVDEDIPEPVETAEPEAAEAHVEPPEPGEQLVIEPAKPSPDEDRQAVAEDEDAETIGPIAPDKLPPSPLPVILDKDGNVIEDLEAQVDSNLAQDIQDTNEPEEGDVEDIADVAIETALMRPRTPGDFILLIEDGPSQQTVDLTGLDLHPLTIGRSATNALVITDAAVSRYHAQLRTEPGDDGGVDFVLEVLNTPNGVELNGTLVYGNHKIREGDEIRIGQTTLRLTQAQAEAA